MQLVGNEHSTINNKEFMKALENKEIKLKIIDVKQIQKSSYNKDYYINIDFQLLANLEDFIKCSVVNMGFGIIEVNETQYKISFNSNLYSILNYAFITRGVIPKHNAKDIIASETEIKEVLKDLEFIATSKYITKTKFKPYYRLEVL